MANAASLSGRVVLGRYRIVAPLARGGMGIVYLGRLEGAAGFAKPVVIKTVIPGAKDDRSAQLFAREARIVSNLEHPSIVGVLDFGEADGEYVMVLEYVHGFHLGSWLRFVQEARGRMPVEHGVEVMLPALDALDFAHRLTRADGTPLDIVHRDVSPANILLDHLGHVKLHDFGIARMADDEFKTQDGTFRGTLSFTAPETLQGVAASPRSDLYACGVVLYHLLAGANPFRGQQPTETLHKVVMHVPPALRSLRPDVPEEISAAVARAMEKDPQRRFDSAASFAAALRGARSWDEAKALADLQRTIHEDFTGPAMAKYLGVETLQSRDAAWRAGGARTALSSSPPPGRPRDSATETAPLAHVALADPTATLQALPSSALLAAARGEVAEATAVTPPLPAKSKRRAWFALALVAGLVLVAGAAYSLLRPNAPAPGPRFLLIEKQSDGSPAASTSAASAAAQGADGAEAAPAVSVVASTEQPVASGKRALASATPSSGSSLSAAFQRQRGRVEGCFRQHAADVAGQQLTVRFQIEPSGAVRSAELVPASLSASGLGSCILSVARSTRFPASDAAVTFTIPITARKTGG